MTANGNKTFAELMDDARDYVPFDEVWYRYIVLRQTGMDVETAFYLAYERALEYKNAEAMR